MSNGIKYVHTNLIAKDWKKLVDFYVEVFGCIPTYPERDLTGKWLDTLTGIENVRLRGMHLRLPGYENGPTLEIFQYTPENRNDLLKEISGYGFGHIAFHVNSVPDMLNKVIEHGGQALSEIVQKQYPELGLLTCVYTRDPEGNFIELQNWAKGT